jgi:dienelactone hydrolase
MRKQLHLIAIAGMTAILLWCAGALPAQNESQHEYINRARAFVEMMAKGAFSAASASFDSAMTAAMPVARLSEAWKSIAAQAGDFQKQTGTWTETMGPYEIIYVTCDFEKMALEVKVVFDQAGRIAGLYFAPAQKHSGYEAPAYAKQDSFRESEALVGKGKWALPGTVTMPVGNGPFPALVLVHGSGPQDRDESMGPNKPFRDLAWGLASRGVAVLRYEKRTKAHAGEMLLKKDSITVKEETVDDALAAITALRGIKEIDQRRIFVLGHSLGGTLAPRIAAGDSNIAGVVILAGMARPLEDAILAQFRYIFSLDSVITDDEKAQLDSLKKQVARVKGVELSPAMPSAELPLGLPAGYWLSLRGYDPPALARKLKQPMLVLQGGRDYQVTSEDYQAWKDGMATKENAEYRLYPMLNHLFIEGKGQISPEDYQVPGHVDKTVIDDIALWISKH